MPAYQSRMLWWALSVLLLSSSAAAARDLGPSDAGSSAPQATLPPGHRQAYASLIYHDSFLLGLRVLGQSLRDSGTER